MSEETSAPSGEAISVVTADAGTGELTMNHAAKMLADQREKRNQSSAESADTATAEPELSAEDNAAPQDEAHGETQEAEPAEEPPIEPPKSWTKAEKERFQSLPRETQEYLHTREQERDRDFRRSQNEIAEQRNAIKAEREAAEKARQQYETKLPSLMQTLQEVGPFSDIRNMADVEKLQAEDPFRFQAYQVHQWKLQATQTELVEAQARQAQEQQTQWASHVQKENELAAEYIPELADKVKGPALTQRVASELLPELGFKAGELNDLASGKSKLSIYDHRVQRLLADALKLRDIQAAPKAVAAKPLPPVQRPGTSKPAGSAVSERVQALDTKLSNSGSLKDAQALLAARRSSQRRAS